jgi:hypothetical protein
MQMKGGGRRQPRGLHKRLWALAPNALAYSNAGDKRRQVVVLSGTQRIRSAIPERAAAIC